MFIVYENTDFYFFWKPHGIPSTFGKEKSFLDYMEEGTLDFDTTDYQSIQKYLDPSLKEVKNIDSATRPRDFGVKHQIETFDNETEYGLLNRLDNDTAGFLYFAKELSIHDDYKQLQAENKIEKHYIAQVEGEININIIDYPIMHRSLEKMIAIKDPKDLRKGRGKEHNVQTFIQLLNYDSKSNISTLLVKIHKGIRHQIRVHLASVAFPIIGDPLYGKSENDEVLHLWSVGFEIKK